LGSFEPLFDSFVGSNINFRILLPTKESKSGQNTHERLRLLTIIHEKRFAFKFRITKISPDFEPSNRGICMEELLDKCCGIDVHQESLTACIMKGSGKGMYKEIREFSTFTDGIQALGDWLREHKVTHVAIESTGVYWKPVFNILTEERFDLMLVNARHVKNVPGRKTDIKDSEWLCKLLKNGLLERNFIPPEDMRNLRDLTRYRSKLVATMASEKNRIIKILETANIKLSSVLSDVFGQSGCQIMEDLAKGVTDPKKLVEHVVGRVKHSKEDFIRALTGRITKHHSFLIRQTLDHICDIGKIIQNIEKEIEVITSKYNQELELLQTVPGVSSTVAAVVLAEIGADMNQFPSDQHISSWAGLSPGSYESAGKKKAPVSYLG
jgi:transposase